MKAAVISANFGGFEAPVEHPPQTIPVDFYHFTEEQYPLRDKALTPRLQARILKMFGWQFAPDYEAYIWVDSSCALTSPESAQLFLDQLEGHDVVVFKHPNRNTIQAEADFLKERLVLEKSGQKQPYVLPRYQNELIDEQLAEIKADKDFSDENLYASTAFVYRNTPEVQDMLKEWWYHTSRYHSIDQLSLPYALAKSGCRVVVLTDRYDKSPYITYVRNKKPEPAKEKA